MSKLKVLLVQPPFTQLNTPYPATAYLKGFLNTQDVNCAQLDLGIEAILKIFSREGLLKVFSAYENLGLSNANVFELCDAYLSTIDNVIAFLQGRKTNLVHLIVSRNYLPEGPRFEQIADLEWAFGDLGIQDKAKHLTTLYLEDISDFIKEIDPDFGFSRYAESIAMAASSFNSLYEKLHDEKTLTDSFCIEILKEKIEEFQPDLIGFSAPFPGNVYSSFKMAQLAKNEFPQAKLMLGGGFANTELRSLTDKRVFEFFDYITLDDGEAPILNIIEHLEGRREITGLKRTFVLQNDEVFYSNASQMPDFKQQDVGTPDYVGLPIDRYLQILEMANPMHRLWNDGRWNKLTLAHGCYWAKCTFCDVSLGYIKIYEAATAKILVDRIEELIAKTGEIGFHFVDEAAPPSMMKELALEIIRRKLTVVWWTNIRFEKSFTYDLCKLLAKSGCIAISGGLEVASDRLLALIDKGVSVAQVSRAARNLTENGIMVHAYLMYGYPTQTGQETIDSLEIVRQLYELNIVKSGFWHRFALTTHSPIGKNPEAFNIEILKGQEGSFANNELAYNEPDGIDHGAFGDGLKKSLYNFMHGQCFEYDLQEWFDFEIPETTVAPDYIENVVNAMEPLEFKPNRKVYWLAENCSVIQNSGNLSNKKNAELAVVTKEGSIVLEMKSAIALWLAEALPNFKIEHGNKTLAYFKDQYKQAGLGNFDKFFRSKTFAQLRDVGLIIV